MAAQESAAGNQVMRWRYGDVSDSNFAVHGRGVPLLVGLLFAVVVFVALCLYLRWRCHRYTPDQEVESSSSAAAVTASLPGLDADAIRGLPVTLYRSPASLPHRAGKCGGEVDDQAALCSICISALVAGEKVKTLPPCGHCFHPDCVDAWLRSQPSCPLCRCLLAAAAAKPDFSNGNDAAV
ncbi:RING-H2 finger protein ATL66-like [Phragmites australis]|uniref:RING-H2 finger protein ATL66-like n=1 Tax=Phragmites australis TaxID=29695 RepID=UPI002D764CB9|nr:RING-H2 finger protein ATL66-like [Phragmites australis]